MLKLFNRKKKDNKGFTLVELVIVVAILAILVGLLAPQYTKYVEKSRKAADASNLDEMVKIVQVYAADPANDLETGDYTITIAATKPTGQNAGNATTLTTTKDKTGLENELNNSIPTWTSTVTKSQKWSSTGTAVAINAKITVGDDGATSVKYYTGTEYAAGNKLEKYMTTGTEK